MQFVVQNRSGHAVSGLQLNVDANALTPHLFRPLLESGATYVVKIPVDQDNWRRRAIVFRTQLVNPPGITDPVPANNRKTSSLAPPKK